MAKFTNLLLAASVAAAGIAAPAAANEDETPRTVVHYGDLDLSSAAGRERLSMRVSGAVKRMCAVETRADIGRKAASRECRAQATRNLDTQLASLLNGNGAELADRQGKLLAAP